MYIYYIGIKNNVTKSTNHLFNVSFRLDHKLTFG